MFINSIYSWSDSPSLFLFLLKNNVDHSSEMDHENMETIPNYGNYSAPKGPVPEWQIAMKAAQVTFTWISIG